MKVISFLGPANYQDTTYRFGDEDKPTRFFPVAVAHFLKPDLMLVCATPTVEKHGNLTALGQDLDRAGVPWQVLPIPEGHSAADLWAIFGALTGAVSEGEEVAFDVTHSFRSLPFLAFLAVAYLKTARQVNVRRVLYGAWEARSDDNISPVFDLTPFVGLLDWITATDQFVQTGDARRLAGLLDADGTGGRNAAQARQTLETVSLAAFLCQPFHLMPAAARLEQDLGRAEAELALTAAPFGVLRQRISQTFGAFALDRSQASDTVETLRAQFRLIEWYYGNNQLIQAVTLAREWVISAAGCRLGQPLDLRSSARKELERAVSGLGRLGREESDGEGGKRIFGRDQLNELGRLMLDTWPDYAAVASLYGVLSTVRNALDHAGHQADAMRLDKLMTNTREKIMPKLRELAVAWGYT